MASTKVTGVCKLWVDGELLYSEPGASIDPGGMKRESKMANGIVVGYQEEAVPSMIEATILHTSTTDIVRMSNLTGQTVRFETDTGTTYTVKNMVTSEPCKLTGGGGFSLKMTGPAAEKE